jgi:ubiquinone/menaquinone biosynthesis C-methylase UbiE
LTIGVVLVSECNELLCSAFNGEELGKSWYSVLISKIQKLNISNAQSVYLTINTMSADNSFDLIKLLNEIRINEVYIGLPDPTLRCYLNDDPIITLDCIYRYTDNLQCEILKQNEPFFINSKQNIKHSPYYSKNRISNLVIENLKLREFIISKDELNSNKNNIALASTISNKYGVEYSEAITIVDNAISEAFNYKYAEYNYSDDTRSFDLDWKKNFISFYEKLSIKLISSMSILNVGVGSGNEAIALFSNCKKLSFVDIARSGLEKIKKQLPFSKVIVSSAEDLSSIPDNSYELYVSLRTYNSSFFDIKKAILEAYRVLKPNSVIIISIANGFLCPEQNCIIPGLIIPGTEFVDIYRGMDTIKLMHTEFIKVGFNNIQVFPTNTEIYLSGVK